MRAAAANRAGPAAVGVVMALAGLLSLTRPAAAQQLSDEQLSVALAALPHVRSGLPSGTTALDPELFCAPRLAGWSCPAAVRDAARRLGLTLHGRAFTHVCPGAPATCRLVGAKSLIVLHPPQIDGREAEVRVDTWWRDSPNGSPVAHRRRELRLARTGAGWRVVR